MIIKNFNRKNCKKVLLVNSLTFDTAQTTYLADSVCQHPGWLDVTWCVAQMDANCVVGFLVFNKVLNSSVVW